MPSSANRYANAQLKPVLECNTPEELHYCIFFTEGHRVIITATIEYSAACSSAASMPLQPCKRHACTHTPYTHANVYTHTCTHTRVHIHVHIYTQTRAYTHTRVHTVHMFCSATACGCWCIGRAKSYSGTPFACRLERRDGARNRRVKAAKPHRNLVTFNPYPLLSYPPFKGCHCVRSLPTRP